MYEIFRFVNIWIPRYWIEEGWYPTFSFLWNFIPDFKDRNLQYFHSYIRNMNMKQASERSRRIEYVWKTWIERVKILLTYYNTWICTHTWKKKKKNRSIKAELVQRVTFICLKLIFVHGYGDKISSLTTQNIVPIIKFDCHYKFHCLWKFTEFIRKDLKPGDPAVPSTSCILWQFFTFT